MAIRRNKGVRSPAHRFDAAPVGRTPVFNEKEVCVCREGMSASCGGLEKRSQPNARFRVL